MGRRAQRVLALRRGSSAPPRGTQHPKNTRLGIGRAEFSAPRETARDCGVAIRAGLAGVGVDVTREVRRQVGAVGARLCSVTNLRNKGLISADRRTKPTLMLTIPRFLFKSSTKDLSLPIFGIVIPQAGRRLALGSMVLCRNISLLASHRGG